MQPFDSIVSSIELNLRHIHQFFWIKGFDLVSCAKSIISAFCFHSVRDVSLMYLNMTRKNLRYILISPFYSKLHIMCTDRRSNLKSSTQGQYSHPISNRRVLTVCVFWRLWRTHHSSNLTAKVAITLVHAQTGMLFLIPWVGMSTCVLNHDTKIDQREAYLMKYQFVSK